MNSYLDVGVVRIQSYLTRAPSLAGRRGASTMVTKAADGVPGILADRAKLNPEAGEIDGVVSLRLAEGTDPRALAADVLAHLRRKLPAATLVARQYDGPSYAAARNDRPLWKQEWHAAVAEWPLAKPCDWCRAWPAGTDVIENDYQDGQPTRRENHCVDCQRRRPSAGWATARTAVPGAERHLLDDPSLAGRTVPNSFVELADMRLGPTTDGTHVATVYADGNGIGAYMRRRGHPAAAPKEIDDATWTAVRTAVSAIDKKGSPQLPVIPHLVGGDDVLVSVPAHGGWRFAAALAETFAAGFAGADGPTLSVGLVIHHRAEPLSDVVELAETLLRAAKRGRPGRATLAWQSVTHDGPEALDRTPIAMSNWPDHERALTALSTQASAQRQELAALCREVRDGVTGTSLDRQIRRMGLEEIVMPFLEPVGIGLEDALGIVRWWAA